MVFTCRPFTVAGPFLYLIRAAVVPFAYALVLTYLLVPLVEYLERRGSAGLLPYCWYTAEQ